MSNIWKIRYLGIASLTFAFSVAFYIPNASDDVIEEIDLYFASALYILLPISLIWGAVVSMKCFRNENEKLVGRTGIVFNILLGAVFYGTIWGYR